MAYRHLHKLGTNKALVLLMLVAISNLVLPIFFGFDNHHDGLILSTVHEVQNALRNSGPWPFNQYGQFWVFPFVVVSFPFNPSATLLIIRILTLFYYLISGWVFFTIANRYLTKRVSLAIVLLFFTAQPFSLGLNSSFLPWPSAFNLMVIALIIERLTSEIDSKRRNCFRYFCVGALVGVSFMTRLQIGALLLFALLVYIALKRNFKQVALVTLGFITINMTVLILFGFRGWISDSFYDSVFFGSNYVRGDSSYVSLLLIRYSQGVSDLARRIRFQHLVAIFLSIAIILMFVSNKSDLPLNTWWTLLVRRCWISISISLIAFYVTYRFINYLRDRKRKTISGVPVLENFIAIICVISSAQIVPLFDQMHYWWAFGPFVLLIPAILKELRFYSYFEKETFWKLCIASFLILTMVNSLGVAAQFNTQVENLPSSVGSYVSVSKARASDEVLISRYLKHHIENHSTVLNLCPNSDVFFENPTLRSSVREFVLWSPFMNYNRYKADFLNARFDYLVSCEFVSPAQLPEEDLNRAIINIRSHYDVEQLSALPDRQGRIWKIYIRR